MIYLTNKFGERHIPDNVRLTSDGTPDNAKSYRRDAGEERVFFLKLKEMGIVDNLTRKN